VFLRKTVALVRQREAAVGMPRLGSTAAYFRTALRDRHADQPEKAPSKPSVPSQGVLPPPPSEADLVQVDRIRMADAAYREMSIEDQEAKREKFIKDTPIAAYSREVKRHGLGRSQAAKAAFCEWLADALWGKPGAADQAAPDLSTTD
jgi:hypothetical protein